MGCKRANKRNNRESKTNGATSPPKTSTGRVNPQASPIISEAELAGKNSGLETVNQNREVFAFFGASLLAGDCGIWYGKFEYALKGFHQPAILIEYDLFCDCKTSVT